MTVGEAIGFTVVPLVLLGVGVLCFYNMTIGPDCIARWVFCAHGGGYDIEQGMVYRPSTRSRSQSRARLPQGYRSHRRPRPAQSRRHPQTRPEESESEHENQQSEPVQEPQQTQQPDSKPESPKKPESPQKSQSPEKAQSPQQPQSPPEAGQKGSKQSHTSLENVVSNSQDSRSTQTKVDQSQSQGSQESQAQQGGKPDEKNPEPSCECCKKRGRQAQTEELPKDIEKLDDDCTICKERELEKDREPLTFDDDEETMSNQRREQYRKEIHDQEARFLDFEEEGVAYKHRQQDEKHTSEERQGEADAFSVHPSMAVSAESD